MPALPPPPIPVIAEIASTSETFSGSLVGETLVIRSDKGPTCKGRLRMNNPPYGTGHLSCSDGRFGHFSIQIRGSMGMGYGNLDGKGIAVVTG